MARGPERTTLAVETRRDASGGGWRFLIVGARRRVMHESKPVYETAEDARAAARDWMTQTLLR